jgi:hypothetical protein
LWSPDRLWFWDGRQWIPAAQAPIAPPPFGTAAPYAAPDWYKPSPGLRVVLLVFLVLASVIWGLFALFGFLGTTANALQWSTLSGRDRSNFMFGLVLFNASAGLFAISLVAAVGVFIRAPWARWVAIAAGIASSMTCLGSVVGIPILVTASRAPRLGEKPPAS